MDTYKVSERVTLKDGDDVRVSGGPYFPSKNGTNIRMGEHGRGTFVSATTDGIFVKFPKFNSPKFVYMGDDKTSQETGVVFKAHKVTKVRFTGDKIKKAK